jgi:hypothetical protein
VKSIKEKKSVSEIAAGGLLSLVDAVKGYDLLDDEFKADKGGVIAYAVKEIVAALEAKPQA